MKKVFLFALLFVVTTNSIFAQSLIQIPDYKAESQRPGANYKLLVAEVRSKLDIKKQQLLNLGVDVNKSEAFREEVALFERWALVWRDKIGINGSFPNPLTGWLNAIEEQPNSFTNQQNLYVSNRTAMTTWTSLGPTSSGVLNGWTFGGGIGRINVVKRHPALLGTMYAGSTAGGLFKTTDLGSSWTPQTDQFAGLGVSDIAFLPANANHMLMATGDYDGDHGNSIGIWKSMDGGINWAPKLSFTLNQQFRIAQIYIDPNYGVNNTIWATTTMFLYKSIDGGETWTTVFDNAGATSNFNDIIRTVNGFYFLTDKSSGKIFRSIDGGTNWTTVYTHPTTIRLDLAYSPNTPDNLYVLAQTNPAFATYTVSTNMMSVFSNVTNSTPGDGNANYNTQEGYNQTFTVSPTNGMDIMIGEFSGKRSTNGGATWTNWLNGYFDPTDPNNWGSGYVHSDHHYIQYIGAANDSLLIGNDGGVYIGPVASDGANYKECFGGLVCTQSYSIAIYNPEPNHLMIGNQDNDGRSRFFNAGTSTYYGASAGDGISTAIHRTNPSIRYVSGTTGNLKYDNNGYQTGYQGTAIPKPAAGVFAAPLEMHLTNGDILYGGYDDVYKGNAAALPVVNWTNLNSGLGDKPKFIALSNHTDPTKQRIAAIGDNDIVRKTVDETTWSTITPPAGVKFNSIYWYRKTGTSDSMLATGAGYNAGDKIFFSADAGANWINISDNMPNILMQNIIAKEGSDSILIATELGVYFARLAPGGGVLRTSAVGYSKFGVGLPNVRVTDMEISYPKNQLFIATLGRGVWMIPFSNIVLPFTDISFSYKNFNADKYSLTWKIEDEDIVNTTLEKSSDGGNFSTVNTFTGDDKKNQPSYLVPKINTNVYYRLYYIKSSGRKVYSQIILIKNSAGAANNITVYPNPVRDYLNITSTARIATVKISTINGVQLTYARPQSNFYSFDMSLLSKGTYLLQVWDENGNVSSEKVIRY